MFFVNLDVARNPASELSQRIAKAEVQAMDIVHQFKNTKQRGFIEGYDANQLTRAIYSALAKKLRYCSKFELRKLHKNKTFTEPNTEMQFHLFKNEPPSRKTMFTDVKGRDQTMDSRLEKTKAIQRKLDFANIIYRNVMVWWKKVSYELSIKKKLAEAQANLAKLNAHNDDDDEYAKYNSK